MSGSPPQSDQWSTAWLMAGVAIVLGIGTPILDRTAATIMAVVALALGATALSARASWLHGAMSRKSVITVLTVGIGFEAFIALVASPMKDARFLAGLAIVGVLCVAAAMFPKVRAPAVVGAIVIHAACFSFFILTMVPGDIDVDLFQQEGSAALLSGRNPYALRFPNIYGTEAPVYSPEFLDGAFLTFGFPYPPLSLLMAVPGYLLGDYRLALIAAISFTAGVVAFARPGPIGPLAAGLFLLSPLMFGVIYYGWTEPFVGVLAALLGFMALRHTRMTPILLGLLIAVKQYVFPILILAVVLLPMRSRRVRWRTGLIAGTVAAATVLPFGIMDPRSFLHSVGVVQLLQPFRVDSVSVPGLIARAGGPELPAAAGFVALGVAISYVLWRAPRTNAGLFAAATVVFLSFFLFSKQAFMNYYFVGLVLSVVAVVVTSRPGDDARTGADQAPTARRLGDARQRR